MHIAYFTTYICNDIICLAYSEQREGDRMARTQAQEKYDAANMAYQTVKVKRDLLEKFKAACAARGDKVNTVLREAMERYVKRYEVVEMVNRDNEE